MTDLIVPPAPALQLNRFNYDDKSTIGELLIQNQFQCNTLEDTARRVKVAGETAIPSGRYQVVLGNHPAHGFCPQLLNVPFYEGILIHWGNSAIDTKGCILVGKYDPRLADWIGQSRLAFEALMNKLVRLNEAGPMWIDIRGGLTPDQMSLTS